MLMFPYTNSVTEGYNNKIKVLKRLAYGLGGHSEKIPTPTIDKEPLYFMEATPGFEPGNRGFADPCLTAWLCRLMERATRLELATLTLAR